MRRLLTAGFILFVLNLTFAQSGSIRFSQMSLSDGLSYNSVNSITQDHLGYMWIGTDDGLNRYDGSSFRIYRNIPEDPVSLRSNTINEIYQDASGMLWIGTNDGLSLYDRKLDVFKHVEGTHGMSVTSMTSLDDKTLWIIGRRTDEVVDLHVVEKSSLVISAVNNSQLQSKGAWKLSSGRNGKIWITTLGNGIFKYSLADKSVTNGLPGHMVRPLIEDAFGNIWVGTQNNGLYFLDAGFNVIKQIHSENSPIEATGIWSLGMDDEGQLWVGTDGKGLYIIDRDNNFSNHTKNSMNRRGISSNVIRCMFSDHKGDLWLGTYLGGISYHNSLNNRFAHYNHNSCDDASLSHDVVLSFAENDDGTYWVGTDGGGLNLMRNGRFEHYYQGPNSIAGDVVLELFKDSDDELWIGSYANGLTRYDGNDFTQYQYEESANNGIRDNSIWSVGEDALGKIWIGTNGAGINIFDKLSGSFEYLSHSDSDASSLSSNSVRAIHRDRKNRMWVATFDGLNLYNASTQSFTRFRYDGDADTDIMLAIAEDDAGNFWIGTYGGGLLKFTPETKEFKHYPKGDIIPSGIIFGVMIDNEDLIWMSTSNGLLQFNPETEEVNTFGEPDGLQGNTFSVGSYYKDSNGRIFVGGNNGFNIFYPSDIKRSDYNPQVILSDLYIDNRTVNVGEENSPLKVQMSETEDITFHSEQSVFGFEFAALDFTNPEKNQYAYIMEGFDDDWNYVGNRNFVTYTNLDPDDYTFRVRATNSDGVWSEQTVALAITVLPPWYATWWFRLLAISLIGGSTFSFVRARQQQRLESQHLLKKKVSEAVEAVEKQNEELLLQKDNLQAAISETNDVITETIDSGNFSARIDTETKSGEWKALGLSINRLFESVINPFQSINAVINRAASSDLTGRYEGEAHGDILVLTDNLNAAIGNLSALLKDIVSQIGVIGTASQEMMMTSQEMNASTTEISSAIAEMSRGANEQMRKVDDSSNLIEGILRFSDDMAQQAQSINETANTGTTKSTEGMEMITELNTNMQKILDFSDQSTASIDTLTDRSKEISRVINIIKEVAAQTNLLALNAAIEAAQAGDSGRGFAVVAEEIRKLAEDSKKSVSEIENLITSVQHDTKSTSELIIEMSKSVQAGEAASRNSSKTFEEISDSYRATLEKSKSIVSATSQQTQDIKNVVDIMRELVVIAEQTAAGTEEVASSANELSTGMINYTERTKQVSEIVKQLQAKVDAFKL